MWMYISMLTFDALFALYIYTYIYTASYVFVNAENL